MPSLRKKEVQRSFGSAAPLLTSFSFSPGRRRDQGLVMLDGVIEVVAVLEPRPVVADGLADDGIENDGQQAAGEAVVIQVNALHRGSGVEHHGGVEEPRHDAEGPAEIARDRGQSGSEQEGELHGALVDIEVHKNAADDHAQHDGGDVAGVLTEGGEAHDGENAAQGWAVEIAAGGEDEGHADEPVDPHVDEHRGGPKHAKVIAGSPAGSAQQAAVPRPGGPRRAAAEKKACHSQP